jgi:hypothetical protein
MFTMIWLAMVSVALASSPASPQAPAADAHALLQRAIDAMGGEALRNIKALEIETSGHAYYIDQSERPEGPFIVMYQQGKELRDYPGRRTRVESQQRDIQGPEWSPAITMVATTDAVAVMRGDRAVPGPSSQLEVVRRTLDLSPERMLFTALDARDLKLEPDVRLRGMMQRAVAFSWNGRRVRILLNPYNGLPTALDVIGPDPLFSMWGVVTETTQFSYWDLEPGGVRYPRQLDVFWNGVTKSSTSVTKLRVNPALDATSFTIADDVRQAFATAKPSGFNAAVLDAARATEIAPGIVLVPGSWNLTFVRQPDGILIIEAPISSGYSAQALDEAARRFPGVPVKGVVTTSDAWPHIGGVREYVARGVPVYALDLNRPILERLLAAPYGEARDLLARAPKAAAVTWIAARTVIGSGDSRVELYPIRGENGERMLMAYFPAHRLLYASDEIQRLRSGAFFMPEYLLETRDAIEREKLVVERVFGMHLPVIPWSDVEAGIAKAVRGSGLQP